ncbi:minor histocompatibility antigen H13-like [Galendromus occidentalis]|uniref:Minor histocompatibility antigen H13-like n=1 Tax=Galendromus occidentalis TaxID=34638 RepID=A0AAJ6QMK6_9ACAR|nr:minor histocompatibility antigen H13-like [Galendromus occidentalis]
MCSLLSPSWINWAGLVTASSNLLMMAMIAIIFASSSFLDMTKKLKDEEKTIKKFSSKYTIVAMCSPLILSCYLVGVYVGIKTSGEENLSRVFRFVAVWIGLFPLASAVARISRFIIPGFMVKNQEYHALMESKTGSHKIIDMSFDRFEIFGIIVAGAIGGWYLMTHHWIANNFFGLALAHVGITEILACVWNVEIGAMRLNSIAINCIVLCGLLVYDVFWVFRTEVLKTVSSLQCPITIVFPYDSLEHGYWIERSMKLGLGDIVAPGTLIAQMLRYDLDKKSGSKLLYFGVTFASYVLGLILAFAVCVGYQNGQPALLYIVPLCLIVPLCVALIRGEIASLLLNRDPVAEGENDANASLVEREQNLQRDDEDPPSCSEAPENEDFGAGADEPSDPTLGPNSPMVSEENSIYIQG